MMGLLKLLFLVFLLNDGSNSAPVDQPADDDFECGISPYELDGTKTFVNADSSMKIINGPMDKNARWLPWMAILAQEGKDDFICSSTIIGRRHILTAAHCFNFKYWYDSCNFSRTNWCSTDTDDFLLSIGTLDWNDEKAVRVKSARIILPPDVHIPHGGFDYRNDIAIIELAEPLTFSDTVRPICLKAKDDQFIYNKTAVIAGWGKTVVKDPSNTALHMGHMLIPANQAICSKRNEYFNGETTFCSIEDKSGTISCKGDSGGLAMVKMENQKRWVQVGIVSFGPIGCAPPDYYTRVDHYCDWIRNATNEDVKCL